MYKLIASLFLILSVASCTRNNTVKDVASSSELKGFWLLDKAKRDGSPTTTLGGLFLQVTDSIIISNFGGDTMASGYIFDAKDMKLTHFIRDTFKYDIKVLNDSQLNMESIISNLPFEFEFRKSTIDSL